MPSPLPRIAISPQAQQQGGIGLPGTDVYADAQRYRNLVTRRYSPSDGGVTIATWRAPDGSSVETAYNRQGRRIRTQALTPQLQRAQAGTLATLATARRATPTGPPASEGATPAPGFVEGLIPVWGSGKQAVHDFETGHPYWGALNTAMAVTDIIPGAALAKDAAKVGVKGLVKLAGSHTWGATRSWMGRRGWADYARQPFHHWLVRQNGWLGKRLPKAIVNQPAMVYPLPMNVAKRLKVSPQQFHDRIHGHRVDGRRFNPAERLWYGTPPAARAGAVSVGGRAANRAIGPQ